jgi:hypothetical protein
MQYYNTKPIRTTNRNARDYVRNGVPFKNSNGQLFALWETPEMFVVYSYGDHWPLFVWYGSEWFQNEEKFSMTTSHHRSYAHPHTETELRSRRWLCNFIANHRANHRTLSNVQSTLGLAA